MILTHPDTRFSRRFIVIPNNPEKKKSASICTLRLSILQTSQKKSSHRGHFPLRFIPKNCIGEPLVSHIMISAEKELLKCHRNLANGQYITSSMTSYSGLLPYFHVTCSSSNEIDFSHQYNKSQNSRSDLSPKRWHCFDRNAPPGNFLLSCAAKRMDVVPYQGVMVWVPRRKGVLELKNASHAWGLGVSLLVLVSKDMLVGGFNPFDKYYIVKLDHFPR